MHIYRGGALVRGDGSEPEYMVSEIFGEQEGEIDAKEENSGQGEVASEHEPELMSADSDDVSVSNDRVCRSDSRDQLMWQICIIISLLRQHN